MQAGISTKTTDGSSFIDTNTALGYYDTESKLQQALQGWSNNAIAPLSRIKISTENRDDTYRVRIITYSLNFEEYPEVLSTVITHPAINVI